MTNKVRLMIFTTLLVGGVIGAGCNSASEATPSPSPGAVSVGAEPGGAASKGPKQMDTGVAPAPSGVKTDLSGGLK